MVAFDQMILTFQKFLHFCSRRFFVLASIGAVMGILLSVVELGLAFTLQGFLSTLQLGDTHSVPAWFKPWVGSMLRTTLTLVICVVIRGILFWWQEYFRGSTQEHFRQIHCSKLILRSIHSRSVSSGTITELLNVRIPQAAEAMMAIQQALLFVCSNTVVFVSMAWISWRLTLIAICSSLILVPPLKWINAQSRRLGEEIALESQKLNHRLMMVFKNLLFIRIYGLQHTEEQVAQTSLRNTWKHSQAFFKSSATLVAVPQIAGILLVCGITGWAVHTGELSGGLLLSFFYLFYRFSQTTGSMIASLNRVFFRWKPLKTLYDWNQADFKAINESLPQKIRPGFDQPIGWNVDNLTFGFDGSPPLFQRFELTVNPQRTLVITGASGSGKSTLIQLLVGELEPQSGKVSVQTTSEAIAVKDCSRQLTSIMGYVGPEPYLIEGSIRENLAYGLAQIPSDAEISRALDQAQCSFVDHLGLDHFITEQGQGLSAGQKQRLSLARALLRAPKVLILDEATANLDSETELKLIDTLKTLKGKMTIVAITHRQALLSIADDQLQLI